MPNSDAPFAQADDPVRWVWWFPGGRAPDPPWEQNAPRALEPESWVMLRRTFHHEGGVERIHVTADGRYILWLNGAEVGRGPVRSWMPTYDDYEVALSPGDNTLAILARWYGRPTVWWLPAPLRGQLGHGGVALWSSAGVVTDASWRARSAPYVVADSIVSEGPPDPEVLTPLPRGWTEPGFDDSTWDAATVLDATPSYGPIDWPREPRPVPQLRADEFEVAGPLDVDAEPVVLDLGRIVRAHPAVSLDEGSVSLTAGEELVNGVPATADRTWSMRVLAPGGAEAFEGVGFRYLAVRGPARGVRVRAVERLAPRAHGASFTCSDPLLDAIWAAGVRTLDLCSTDAFIDCPGREQRAWVGDGYIHTLVSLLTNPDTRPVRWNLRLHGTGARPDGFLPMVAAGDFGVRDTTLPDGSLTWLMSLARYVDHTGDDVLLEEMLPVAARIVAAFERYRAADGLLADVPGWVFLDWAQLQRGRSMCTLDGMYALALRDYATLCARAGDDGSAARARAKAERTREAMRAYWDPTREAFIDTLGGRRVSQQANTMAILAGAATDTEPVFARILDPARLRVTRTPGDPGGFDERIGSQYLPPEGFDDEQHVVAAQPFFCHFLHRALARAGRFADLLASIRRWETMLQRGDGCLGEYWDSAPGLGSRAHAWAATPTYDLVTHILGGDLAGLEWAEATVVGSDGEWVTRRAVR